ncbi:unnamed protein product [Closterium sp. Naga37s-1]|nr:unnamed protein product [Closterium sp. Naga37s-1]
MDHSASGGGGTGDASGSGGGGIGNSGAVSAGGTGAGGVESSDFVGGARVGNSGVVNNVGGSGAPVVRAEAVSLSSGKDAISVGFQCWCWCQQQKCQWHWVQSHRCCGAKEEPVVWVDISSNGVMGGSATGGSGGKGCWKMGTNGFKQENE